MSSSSTARPSITKDESNEDIKRNKAAIEKARVKAEYRKIMSESGRPRKVAGVKGKAASKKDPVSESDKSSSKGKRKERTDEGALNIDVEVGDRVKVKFKDGVWYKGDVSSLEKGKVGEVVKVGISYDVGEREESNWPDKDIVLIKGDGRRGEEEEEENKKD